jgi:guanylate kinase
MSHWNEFDYVVVNDVFDRALEELTRIVDSKGEALRAHRPALIPLLAELLA